MTKTEVPLPEIVSQEEWRAERKKLLKKEKELTIQKDKLNAEHRRLPMRVYATVILWAGMCCWLLIEY